jgi:membrane protein YqaA with SNARE-associated domain
MTTEQQEKDWRSRLDVLGENTVRADLNLRNGVGIGFNTDMMQVVAREWLREKEETRERRERLAYRYVKWTLIAAVVAVFVGIAGIVATIMTSPH